MNNNIGKTCDSNSLEIINNNLSKNDSSNEDSICSKNNIDESVEEVTIRIFNEPEHGLTYGQLRGSLSLKKKNIRHWSAERMKCLQISTQIVTACIIIVAGVSLGYIFIPKLIDNKVIDMRFFFALLIFSPLWIPVAMAGPLVGMSYLLDKSNQCLARPKREEFENLLNQLSLYDEQSLLNREILTECFRTLSTEIRPYELCSKMNQRQVSFIPENSDIIEKLSKAYQKIWNLLNFHPRSENDSLKLCKKIEKLSQNNPIHPTDPIDFLTLFLQKLDTEQLSLDLKRYCLSIINQFVETNKLVNELQFDKLCQLIQENPDLSLKDAVGQLQGLWEKDLIIQTEKQDYKVSKAVLTTQSDYFRLLFSSNWQKGDVVKEDLGDIAPKIIKKFFKILHEEPVSLISKEYTDFFALCDRFLTPMIARHYFEDCANYIKTLRKRELEEKNELRNDILYITQMMQKAPYITPIFLQEMNLLNLS